MPDLALVRTAVPALGIALPSIGTAPPAAGDELTLLGYGCRFVSRT